MAGASRRLSRTFRAARSRLDSLAVRARRLRLRATGPVVTVFMYHRVTESTPPAWGPWRYAVSQSTFARHADRLASRYDVVDLETLLDALDGDATLPQRPAVVTVDDGYRDTLTRALPVLKRRDIPATVYVSTALLGRAEGPLSYRLAAALSARSADDRSLADVPVDGVDRLPTAPGAAFDVLYAALKFEPPEVRETALDALPVAEGAGAPMLTREGVRELAKSDCVTVGAHGHDHCPLTILDDEALQTNVETCRRILTENLDRPVPHFSYPYGAHDERVAAAVEAAGFASAVTTGDDVVSLARPPDRYEIPRVDAAGFRP